MNDLKLLASLAVYSRLMDEGHDDFLVIEKFLLHTIIARNLEDFTLVEITKSMNEDFSIEIPQAIVNQVIRRLKIQSSHGKYYAKQFDLEKEKGFEGIQSQIYQSIQKIESSLFLFSEGFIRRQKQNDHHVLTAEERSDISHAFRKYVADQNGYGAFTNLIAEFVSSHAEELRADLNNITQGVLFYEGIKSDSPFKDKIDLNLTIIVAQDVLFDCAGYNGPLFKEMFEEFHSLVVEINSRNRTGSSIKLRYLQSTMNDITDFFSSALTHLRSDQPPDIRNNAMKYILDQCVHASDIASVRSKFENELKRFSIDHFRGEEAFFSEQNRIYNCIDNETSNRITENLLQIYDKSSREYFENIIGIANKISVIDQGARRQSVEDCGAFYLTRNQKAIDVGFQDIFNNKKIKLITYPSFLVRNFWIKLKKGFGGSNIPKSFDVIIRSQIVMSSLFGSTLAKKFDELKRRHTEGLLPRDEALDTLSKIRDYSITPDNINAHTIDDFHSFISSADLMNYRQQKQNDKNTREEEKIKAKKMQLILVDSLEKNAAIQRQKKAEFDDKFKTLKTRTVVIALIPLLLAALAPFILVTLFPWDKIERWAWASSFFPSVGMLIFNTFYAKTINPRTFYIVVLEKKRQGLMHQLHFNPAELTQTEAALNQYKMDNRSEIPEIQISERVS